MVDTTMAAGGRREDAKAKAKVRKETICGEIG
jgi:hypothetical protein